MLKFKKFLCVCFGNVALLFAVVSFEMVPHLLRAAHWREFQNTLASADPAFRNDSAVLLFLANLIFAMPPLIACLFGMAWWTLRRGKPSGRRWAIAASVAMLVLCVPLLVAIVFAARYAGHSPGLANFFIPESILVAAMMTLGIGGLAAFGRRQGESQRPLAAANSPRIAGDGTNVLFDGLSLVIGFAGFLAGLNWWERWGRAQHLPASHFQFSLSLLILSFLITTALHETGHAAAGLALGMKLRAFLVGPLQWTMRDGKWSFHFAPAKLFVPDGATGLVPTDPNQDRWETICMIAAGPIASLLTGLIAFNLALGAKGKAYEAAWGFFAVIATIGLVEFLVNVIPLRPAGLYSDGARIYQLLKGGRWADLHRVTSLAASTSVTALRPRDYDIEAIRRAEQSFTVGRQALMLRLLATSYYLDCERFSEAREALDEAEAASAALGTDVPAELCIAFVFRIAFLRKDPASARAWWERMEAKKPAKPGANYWLAKSALLWSEGHLDEAREAWEKGDALAQELPAVGDCDFDRHRSELLRQAIEAEVMAPAG
jgi:tetratricopeptide (TPR) repeat protein